MKVLFIILNSINDVKEFVKEAGKLPYETKVHSKGYIVNAASIMGLFSLDLSDSLTVEFDNRLNWEDIEPFKRWEAKS